MDNIRITDRPAMGVRRFGRVNWLGTRTLATREVMRFMAVWQQTIFAPLMTAALFVLVFALALGRGRGEIMGLPYLQFLGPGILMMTVIQNSFANTSSSITSAKVQGNIVDTLMPPLSAAELLAGYLSGSVARAGLVAVVIGTGMVIVTGAGIAHPLWAIAFVLMAALLLGGLGILAGIMAQKFDQMAAITNFVITPLSFLSGNFLFGPDPARAVPHAVALESDLLPDRRCAVRRDRGQRCAAAARADHLRAGRGGDPGGRLALAEFGIPHETVIARRANWRYGLCHDRMDRHTRPSPTLTPGLAGIQSPSDHTCHQNLSCHPGNPP